VQEYRFFKPTLEVNAYRGFSPQRVRGFVLLSSSKYSSWDPKESDLFLHRMKPGEILVEVRSDTDVQIVREMWV